MKKLMISILLMMIASTSFAKRHQVVNVFNPVVDKCVMVQNVDDVELSTFKASIAMTVIGNDREYIIMSHNMSLGDAYAQYNLCKELKSKKEINTIELLKVESSNGLEIFRIRRLVAKEDK